MCSKFGVSGLGVGPRVDAQNLAGPKVCHATIISQGSGVQGSGCCPLTVPEP